MSDELSNIAVEVSVWDLEGTCPYYKVTEKIQVSPKTTLPIIEMKYPKSKNAKPVYFLLLKLFRLSDTAILSRNFYWLHLPGNDYKLLEPYRTKKVPLKIKSQVLIMGSSYKVQMHLQNISKNSNSSSITCKRVEQIKDDNDFDINSVELAEQVPEKQGGDCGGLLGKLGEGLCRSRSAKHPNVVMINGTASGVAFFLHFSVHAAKKDRRDWEDTRILPVHYSDNYISLVPGEAMTVDISFEVPRGISPSITLSGWNYHRNHTVF